MSPPPDGAPRAAETPPPEAVVQVTMSSRTVLRIALLVVVVLLVVSLGDTLVAFFLAGFLACGLHPVVNWLQGRFSLSRVWSALLLYALVFVAVCIVIAVVVVPIYSEFRTFVAHLPQYIDELKTSDVFQQIDDKVHLSDEATKAAQNLGKALPETASAVLGIGGSLVTGAFAIVTLAFLTLYLLIELPSVLRNIAALMPPDRAATYLRVQNQVNETITNALLGQMVIATIAGTVAGLASWAIGLPFPAVLGVIVAAFDLIPQVGSTIAGVILGLVGLTVGLPQAIAIVLVIIVYQQVENYLIQPAVMRRAVEISPLVTIASVIAGAALFGVLGAILAVPVAASVKVVLAELLAPRRARMAALREEAGEAPETALEPGPA